MKQISFTCDVCGTVKRETNHWWAVSTGDETGLGDVYFTVEPWPAVLDTPHKRLLAESGRVYDICGAECLHKKLNEFLADQAKKENTTNANSQVPPPSTVTSL